MTETYLEQNYNQARGAVGYILFSQLNCSQTISFLSSIFCNLNRARVPVTNSWPFNSFLANKRDAKNSELQGKMLAIFYSLLFTRVLFFCWFFVPCNCAPDAFLHIFYYEILFILCFYCLFSPAYIKYFSLSYRCLHFTFTLSLLDDTKYFPT